MQDVIEQEITINADLERVWELITQPGWWVPTEQPQPADRTPGSVTVRESEKYGRFPVQVVEMRPRTYAAFRWASQFPGEELTDGHSTLIEFFVQDESGEAAGGGGGAGGGEVTGGGVTVRVRESGFAGLDAPEEVRRSGLSSNTEGWQLELAGLRKRSEADAG
jgi:uncharacterized protein YndB with AHSA1/START domain